MSKKENIIPLSKDTGDAADAADADGRRQRSQRSRRQIIDALFDLIRGGDITPSAAQVAERAGVSLRTVFRHFEDFESLNREMAAQLEPEVLTKLLKPYEATTWRGRLGELIDNRVEIYEFIMPIKIAAGVRKYRSAFLMDRHVHFLNFERATLRNILPEKIGTDSGEFRGIQAAMSFQNWHQLRRDHGLSLDDAKDVVSLVVERLLADQ